MTAGVEAPFRALTPLDGSPLAEQAIPYAAALAGPHETIHLLHVAPHPRQPRDIRGFTLPTTDADLSKYESRLRQDVADVAERWQSVAPRVAVHVAYGDPAEEILAAADQEPADLIVMASHGRGALGRWRFGSVADRVTRSAPGPVMIVRPWDAPVEVGPAPIYRLVVPLDGSELAARALPVAERLARRTHRPVHLVRVLPSAAESWLPALGDAPPDMVASSHDLALAAERNAAAVLEEAAERLTAAGVATTWSLEAGSIFERIGETAKAGDVIVLASHGRGGLRRWALGSLAEAPVVVVRARPDAAEADPSANAP